MEIPKTLRSALTEKRLSSSYLFYGRDTSYYKPVVIDFFSRIVCGQGDPAEFCGDCEDCDQIESLSHPDLVAPGESVNELSGDSGERLGVDVIREEILEAASLTPARSPRKLFWLNNPMRFTPEASNALLKVLEEPPGEATFVLTARSRWDCLPTIRSRCQWIRFPPVYSTDQTLLERLRKQENDAGIEEDSIEEWYELLNGNRSVYEFSWNRDSAEQFLTMVLFLVHDKYTNSLPEEGISFNDDKISYRLVDPVLERLDELERGGHPGTIINSLLEEVFLPEEKDKWKNVI